MRDDEFKFCPYCSEQVRATAIKCRYCGEWFEGRTPSLVPPPIDDQVEAKASEPTTPSSLPPLPPVAELGEGTEIVSDLLPLPAVEEEPPITSTTAKPPVVKRQAYFLRHWRGELSLGVSYWVNGFLVNFMFLLVIGIVPALQETISLKMVAALCIGAYAISLLLSFWQIVGTWRSAANHGKRGGLPIWGTLAQLSLILATVKVGNLVATSMLPQTVELWNILCGDERIPAYNIQVLPGGAVVEFSGGFRAGSAQDLERVLVSNPQAKVLRLKSPGGRIHEATRVARFVRGHGLDTYASDYCLSAATLVFIAGKERTMGEGAKLGFHMATFPGMTPEQIRAGDEGVRQAMVSAGVARDFIDRALATPNGDMWYPSVDELKAAGVVTKEDAPLRTFASTLSRLLDDPTSSNSFKPEASGQGEMDRFTTVVLEFSRRWSPLFVELNTALERTNASAIGQEEVLQDLQKIRDCISIQAKRMHIIEVCRSKAHGELTWLHDELAAMNFSEPNTKEMVKGMDVGTLRKQLDRFLDLRSKVETAKDQRLRFMLGKFGDYQLANSKVLFSKAEDVEEYNALTKAIAVSGKALEEFNADLLNSSTAIKEDLRKLAR